MRPSDFKLRSVEGLADDWPITYEELLPFYERMDAEMNVSGTGGDPAYPSGAAPPLPGLPIGKVGRKAAEGMNRLGWHWWPAAHAIPSRAIGNQQQCARRGTCMFGCPEGAKGSTDLTLWPKALEHGAKLITGARVREITTNGNGLATGAVWVDRDGHEHMQDAEVVVVAGNGVGTPRLLLLSGLANTSGLVGKRLMLHPYMSVLGIYEEELESWLGPWGTPLLSLQFADTDETRGFPRGAQWDVMPIGGPLMALARYDGRPFAERWGRNVHDLVERTLGRAFDWGIGIEDLPSDTNAVTLDPALSDTDGIPAPKIHYRIDKHARANLVWQLERAKEAHEAAGAVDTLVTDWSEWGWHLLGTCRMGDDPATSVVDHWGRTHDVPNLYVLDGSVFVTSGPQPPTATICANALRCTEHLIAAAGLQATPA
jgi:choline dehydrogenase-like flavoprotein